MLKFHGYAMLGALMLLRCESVALVLDECDDDIEKCDSSALYQTGSALLMAKDRAKQIEVEGPDRKKLMVSPENIASTAVKEVASQEPVAAAMPTALTGSRQRSEEQEIPGIAKVAKVELPTPAPGMQSLGLPLPLLGDGSPQHPWMWVQGKPVVEFLLGHTATRALIDAYAGEETEIKKNEPKPLKGVETNEEINGQTKSGHDQKHKKPREPTVGEAYAYAHEMDVPTNRVQMMTTLAIWSCLVLLLAKFYGQRGEPPSQNAEDEEKKTEEEMRTWSSGIFDCCNNVQVCLMGMCCPLILFSDTMATVHVLGFWVTLIALVALTWLDLVVLPLFVWIVIVVVMVYYRHKLRAKFEMENCSFSTVIGDFVGYCFCFPCFLSQDARHVADAVRSGHSAAKAVEEEKA